MLVTVECQECNLVINVTATYSKEWNMISYKCPECLEECTEHNWEDSTLPPIFEHLLANQY